MLRIHTRVGQIGFKTHICATSRLNIEAIKDEHYVLTQNTKLHQQPWQKNLATIPNQDLILSIVKGYQNSPKLARERHTLVGPSARNLLHHYGIDPSSISPTGPHNVILKTDVLKFIEQQKIQPASSQSSSKPPSAKSPSRPVKRVAKEKFKDNELSNMRKTIAKRLTLSKTTIPHAYMITDCKLNDILKLRQEYKRNNIKTSVNDFVIKAAALSLKQVKEINVLYDEQKNIIQYLPSVDIAIAVATDSGLITPIIREANKLKVDEISSTVKQLADKARQGKLQPHEFQGGTFSISNLGMFGITEFSAVINPPQSAILAIGSSRFVLDDSDVIDQVFSVTLSYDARAISEESAAKFLEILKTFIETPSNLERYGDGTDLRRLSLLVFGDVVLSVSYTNIKGRSSGVLIQEILKSVKQSDGVLSKPFDLSSSADSGQQSINCDPVGHMYKKRLKKFFRIKFLRGSKEEAQNLLSSRNDLQTSKLSLNYILPNQNQNQEGEEKRKRKKGFGKRVKRVALRGCRYIAAGVEMISMHHPVSGPGTFTYGYDESAYGGLQEQRYVAEPYSTARYFL